MKSKLMFVGAGVMGLVLFGAIPAQATGGPCNGRVDVNCQDTSNNNFDCTLYVQALNGCQIGT